MLIINGNEMRLTKGDDADIVCNVDVDGEAYTPSAGDVFTLTVRKFPTSDSNVILTASSSSGSGTIHLGHAQTSNLTVGRYSADIQWTHNDGTITTIWPVLTTPYFYTEQNFMNFCVMPEVTM